MGFFPDFFQPAAKDKVKTFTISINDVGEAVICKLGDEGKPVDFTTCTDREMLFDEMVDQLKDNKTIVEFRTYIADNLLCSEIFCCQRWSWVVRALNGRSSKRKNRFLCIYATRMAVVRHFIQIGRENGKAVYRTTARADELDALHDPPPKPEPKPEPPKWVIDVKPRAEPTPEVPNPPIAFTITLGRFTADYTFTYAVAPVRLQGRQWWLIGHLSAPLPEGFRIAHPKLDAYISPDYRQGDNVVHLLGLTIDSDGRRVIGFA